MRRRTEPLHVRVIGSLWGVLTFVVAGPFLLWGSLWWLRGRATDAGLEVISALRGVTARYSWAEIRSMRMVGYGPMTVPELTLASGDTLMLKRDRWEQLAPVLSAHGIPVDNPWLITGVRVTGAVADPGWHDIEPPRTLEKAVAAAGGFVKTPLKWPAGPVHVRRADSRGVIETLTLDLGDTSANWQSFVLEPTDQVAIIWHVEE